jgi:hypothetical protein
MNYTIPENAIIQSIDGDYSYQQSKHTPLEGLHIQTDKGSIILAIDMEGQCCEAFGALFLETPDNTSHFIGATILNITDLEVDNTETHYSEEANETQLQITTTKGVLQYAVYNSHNGYYSHATFLQVIDYTENGYL